MATLHTDRDTRTYSHHMDEKMGDCSKPYTYTHIQPPTPLHTQTHIHQPTNHTKPTAQRDGLDLNWPSLGSFDWNPAAIPTPPPLPDIDWVRVWARDLTVVVCGCMPREREKM